MTRTLAQCAEFRYANVQNDLCACASACKCAISHAHTFKKLCIYSCSLFNSFISLNVTFLQIKCVGQERDFLCSSFITTNLHI